MGIIRANSINENDFHSDSIILESCGFIPDKFTGNPPTRRMFNFYWIDDTVIFIKRDDSNCLYFGIDDENSLQMAYTDIAGPFRIVMGFTNLVDGDIFELEELKTL